MEGGVSPPVEVDPWKDAGLARNPRVDLVVWQHHRVHLQRFFLRFWGGVSFGFWMSFKLLDHPSLIIIRLKTWMFSMSSELSQRMEDSFTLLISASWKKLGSVSHNNREGFKKAYLVVFDSPTKTTASCSLNE